MTKTQEEKKALDAEYDREVRDDRMSALLDELDSLMRDIQELHTSGLGGWEAEILNMRVRIKLARARSDFKELGL